MARIKEKNFYHAMAVSLNKSDKMVEKYMRAFIDQLFKELNRGNEVTISRFATFIPKLIGGEQMNVCGTMRYVEPRVGVEMRLTNAGLQLMNNTILDYDSKKRIKEGKLLPYEKEILGLQEKGKEPVKKKDLKEVFDKVVEEMHKKLSEEIEEEDVEDYYGEDDEV